MEETTRPPNDELGHDHGKLCQERQDIMNKIADALNAAEIKPTGLACEAMLLYGLQCTVKYTNVHPMDLIDYISRQASALYIEKLINKEKSPMAPKHESEPIVE